MRLTHGLVARSLVPSSLWSCTVERAAGLDPEDVPVLPVDVGPASLAHTFRSGQQGLLLTGACRGPGVQLRPGRSRVLLRPESPSRAPPQAPLPAGGPALVVLLVSWAALGPHGLEGVEPVAPADPEGLQCPAVCSCGHDDYSDELSARGSS